MGTKSITGAGELCRFTLFVLKGRWFQRRTQPMAEPGCSLSELWAYKLSIFATFLIMAGAGATYLFGTYSKSIKSSLGYDQTTLNLLGFFKDLGANVGVLSGLIAEVTPTWFVLLIGSAMNFAGYFMIWLAVTGKIPKPQVWHMCCYICIGANSQNFANTGALVTCVKNFPESRGAMLGLLKGFVGLSGAMFTQIYLAIYGNDSTSLILLVAWLPAALSVAFVFTIREIKSLRQPNELRVFYHFLYISIALALFLMAMNIAQRLIAFSHSAYAVTVAVVCVLLFSPLLIAIREELALWDMKKKRLIEVPEEIIVEKVSASAPVASPSPAPTQVESNLGPKTTVRDAEKSCFAQVFSKRPERGEDYSILQALLSIDMLILFAATFCGLGTSLTSVDNLGQIGESLGYPAKTVSSFVSLVSIWNYFGRVFAGFVSESLLLRYKFPRPLMMTLVLLLSCVGQLLIAFPMPGSLYISSIIIGFSFGAQLPLLFAIISELFGLKYYSTLFNCGQIASPLGSYILNVKVTGMLYDRQALKELAKKGMDRSSVKELICIGVQCYRLPFIILAIVTFTGAVVSLILVVRTREFYKGDIYEKFRDQTMDYTSNTELASVGVVNKVGK